MAIADRVVDENEKIEKHSEIVTFAAKPYEERFVDSFSLKSRQGKKYLVMNMGLQNYNDLLAEKGITRVTVLALKSGECYIVDVRVPKSYYR